MGNRDSGYIGSRTQIAWLCKSINRNRVNSLGRVAVSRLFFSADIAAKTRVLRPLSEVDSEIVQVFQAGTRRLRFPFTTDEDFIFGHV
jgi:hypothetical protein